MKKVVVLIIISLCFGCNKKAENAKENVTTLKSYIISQEDKKNIERDKKNNVPPPFIPVGISVENNLIIDRNSDIYYYQRNKRVVLLCNYGIENDTIPKFIDLQPKDIIKIPKDCIEKFIDENVMIKGKRRQILIVASIKDSITDHKILSFIYNLKVPTYVIRRTTQEEDTVLNYKKKDLFYDSKEIKWDKTKIKFPK